MYQGRAGDRQVIAGSVRVIGNRTAGFEIAEYDRAQSRVIDPIVVGS
jgi:hypothetical protein